MLFVLGAHFAQSQEVSQIQLDIELKIVKKSFHDTYAAIKRKAESMSSNKDLIAKEITRESAAFAFVSVYLTRTNEREQDIIFALIALNTIGWKKGDDFLTGETYWKLIKTKIFDWDRALSSRIRSSLIRRCNEIN